MNLAQNKINIYLTTVQKVIPTGSCPGKVYDIAKLRKIPVNGNMDNLPRRPIVSNTNTVTYYLAKYLSKL